MADEKDTSAAPETGADSHGNAGVSERTEQEIESGLTAETGGGDDDEILEQLAEADPKRAVVGLKKRLAKLTSQRNAAREAQSERDTLKTKLAEYERRDQEALRKREEAKRRTPEGQEAEARRRAVRETIDETYGLGTSELLEEQRSERRLAKEGYAQQGISYLRSELEDHGIPVTPETLIRYERAVGSEMAEDANLLAAFRRPGSQKDAIAEAFNRVRDGVINPVLKTQGAKALARIERNRSAVLGGGANSGAVAGIPEPEVDYTAGAKGLRGRALEDYWSGVKDKEWKRLSTLEGN